MRMATAEAMRTLSKQDVQPDLICIDGDHRYSEVKADIDIALELFPDAVIFGADYDFRDVERAVQEVAKRLRRDVYLEAGKYWVLYQVSVSQ